VIVRAAMRSRTQAFAAASAAELATLAGAALETALASRIGLPWINGLLAFAAGTFVYLGYHAIDAEYKRRGAVPALLPAATGVVGSSLIRLLGGAHTLF
jgi:zinc transporter ZupT